MAICRGPSPVSVDSRAAHHPNRQPERRDSAKTRRGSDVFSHTGIVSHSARTRTRARNAVAGKTRERCTRTSRKDLLNCCLCCCRFSPTNWKKRANAFGREKLQVYYTTQKVKNNIFNRRENSYYFPSLLPQPNLTPPLAATTNNTSTHPHHLHSPHHTDLTSAFKKESGSDAEQRSKQPDPHLDEIQRGACVGLRWMTRHPSW